MSLALQEAGTIGESKAAEKSPCRGQRIGAERQEPEIAQKLILFLLKEKFEGFAGGEKERRWGKKRQTRTLGYSETSLRNFNSKYVLYQLS